MVLVPFLGTPAGVQHVVGVVAAEGETIALAVSGILDGIPQTAGLPHNGNGAVAQRDHLGQAAGLRLGRHQEDVGAGVDLAGQRRHKGDAHAAAAGMPGRQLVEEALVGVLAGAQDHQLDALGQNIFGHGADQVHALVGYQTGDHGHDGAAVLLQAKDLLQFLFTGRFALLHRVGVEVGGHVGVGFGVVALHVDAVEDAAQLVLFLPQQIVQTMAEPGVQDLAGIAGAHGGDAVGHLDGALHKVGAAIVLHNMGIPAADAAGILQNIQAVFALILDVVDGEHALGIAQLGDAVLVLQQVDGYQSGLPVVAVDDVGPPVQLSRRLDDGPGEVGEPLAVVEVAVHLPALEVVLVVYKPVGDPVPLQLEDAAVHLPPGQRDVEILQEGHLAAPLPADALVQGENDLDLMAGLGQSFGQGAGHIGQAAGFDEGHRFRGGKQDFHSKTPFSRQIHRRDRRGDRAGTAPPPRREQGRITPRSPWQWPEDR